MYNYIHPKILLFNKFKLINGRSTYWKVKSIIVSNMHKIVMLENHNKSLKSTDYKEQKNSLNYVNHK
jgi:hypothetical protein